MAPLSTNCRTDLLAPASPGPFTTGNGVTPFGSGDIRRPTASLAVISRCVPEFSSSAAAQPPHSGGIMGGSASPCSRVDPVLGNVVYQVPPIADPDVVSSSSSSAAPIFDSTPAPATSLATNAAHTVASSPTVPPPPFLFQGSSPASGSHFAPLFTTPPPPPPAATTQPRHPIFSDHITNHIKFHLNPADHNYHKWKSFFLMVLIRYGVLYLIEHPPPPNADAAYLELDAHVALCLYATLADPMIDHVVGATTTYSIWKNIEDFFLANRVARFMVLNRQYRNLKQGDLSVSEYARRMKLLTDDLADIDHAVSETDLTTQFLHGLDKRLDTIRGVLGDQELPFDTVLSRVVLLEESQAQRAAEESASALAFPGGDRAPNSGSESSARGSNERAPTTGQPDRSSSDRPQ
ncbi:hypothetical protein D1007_49464 [Hordeum vulgare]|nr:hypothetical protein D1007_49464 [Hordeum vulgare]